MFMFHTQYSTSVDFINDDEGVATPKGPYEEFVTLVCGYRVMDERERGGEGDRARLDLSI